MTSGHTESGHRPLDMVHSTAVAATDATSQRQMIPTRARPAMTWALIMLSFNTKITLEILAAPSVSR